LSGKILFVSDTSKDPSEDGAVAEYDATTGEILNANILKDDPDSSFPTGMAVESQETTSLWRAVNLFSDTTSERDKVPVVYTLA
jgi:hypothetical protein